MGGRGARMLPNGFTSQEYKAVGSIAGVKVLRKIEGNQNIPDRSNTPGTAYIRLSDDNKFRQYREYGQDRKPVFELGYGNHKGITSLHVHYWEGDVRHTREFTGKDDEKHGKMLRAAGMRKVGGKYVW